MSERDNQERPSRSERGSEGPGIALVVGGSSGIGAAVAKDLANKCDEVVINYRSSRTQAEEVVKDIHDSKGSANCVQADVGTETGRENLAEYIASFQSPLKALVYGAVSPLRGALAATDVESLEVANRVNLLGFIDLVQRVREPLGNGGRVIYLSSHGAKIAVQEYGPLGVGKAAAEAAVRYLAVELAPEGIAVNAVSPGPVGTGAFERMFPDDSDKRLQWAARKNPTGRGVDMADLVQAVRSLIWQDGMIQGQALTVDGGLTLRG